MDGKGWWVWGRKGNQLICGHSCSTFIILPVEIEETKEERGDEGLGKRRSRKKWMMVMENYQYSQLSSIFLHVFLYQGLLHQPVQCKWELQGQNWRRTALSRWLMKKIRDQPKNEMNESFPEASIHVQKEVGYWHNARAGGIVVVEGGDWVKGTRCDKTSASAPTPVVRQ